MDKLEEALLVVDDDENCVVLFQLLPREAC